MAVGMLLKCCLNVASNVQIGSLFFHFLVTWTMVILNVMILYDSLLKDKYIIIV